MTETTVLSLLSTLPRMDAETFCERWFDIDQLEPEQRERKKKERGYRAKCARVLSTVLKKPYRTVDSWGSRFEGMPEDSKATLAYADALRVQLKAAPDELLYLFLEQHKS
ncbi:MAG: hypothetical protein WA919_05865 [Coleofasciculaceae cyanobacterium]